jgi:hypothetical protein
VERALQALEAAALRTIDAFGAQEVSNTLHIMAKSRYRPWDRTLLPELEGRAEALAGTFMAQDVANTLWAYATMGRAPGAGMMRELEGRAEALAGTFNAQDGATLLKRRYLQLLGHTLVSLPYWEWERCQGAGEREQYLRSKLDGCRPFKFSKTERLGSD